MKSAIRLYDIVIEDPIRLARMVKKMESYNRREPTNLPQLSGSSAEGGRTGELKRCDDMI